MTKPSRMRIEAVWDHETGFGKLMVAGDPDGHYYFGPAIDLYIQELKKSWLNEMERLAKCSDGDLDFVIIHMKKGFSGGKET